MRCPSLIRLVGFLQQHGLTYQHLVTLVRCSQAQHSGPVVLHFLNGRIMTVEEARPAPKRAREDEADAWR